MYFFCWLSAWLKCGSTGTCINRKKRERGGGGTGERGTEERETHACLNSAKSLHHCIMVVHLHQLGTVTSLRRNEIPFQCLLVPLAPLKILSYGWGILARRVGCMQSGISRCIWPMVHQLVEDSCSHSYAALSKQFLAIHVQQHLYNAHCIHVNCTSTLPTLFWQDVRSI